MESRLSYESSCKVLQKRGFLGEKEVPPVPKRQPSFDDEGPLGLYFFRTAVDSIALENLTLPRTYFGRSLLEDVGFVNCDLTESRACWNDFINVRFTNSGLRNVDFRGSILERCDFESTNLNGADFRQCHIEQCSFRAASMKDVQLNQKYRNLYEWTEQQLKEISWQADDGEEPPGG